jgi:hypothetical protein
MQRLAALMKEHPKTTLITVACILAWAVNTAVVTRTVEQLLSATIRVGFKLFDGEDMLLGIG